MNESSDSLAPLAYASSNQEMAGMRRRIVRVHAAAGVLFSLALIRNFTFLTRRFQKDPFFAFLGGRMWILLLAGAVGLVVLALTFSWFFRFACARLRIGGESVLHPGAMLYAIVGAALGAPLLVLAGLLVLYGLTPVSALLILIACASPVLTARIILTKTR